MKNIFEKIWTIKIKPLPLHPQNKRWSLRLSVRTQDFHSCKRGSIPLETTNKNKK